MGAVQLTWFWFNEFKPEFKEGIQNFKAIQTKKISISRN